MNPALPLLLLATQPRDVTQFLRDLVDREPLSGVDYAATKMISTYDLSGGNADGFRPGQVHGNVYTIADLKGPGVVRRFYCARPGGMLRIIIDGRPKPLIEMPCAEFFSGRRAPFVSPVAGPMGGGFYSFFPIPFEKSLRIETVSDENSFGEYYQVTCHGGSPVRSLALPLAPEAQTELARVLDIWRNPGRPLPSPPGESLNRRVVVEPGSHAVLSEITGAGTIDQFHLRISSSDPARLRRSLLQMRWDDQETDAVNSPVGDFFGNGFSQAPFRSLLMGLTGTGYYSYFPMPFARRALIRLVNESPTHPLNAECRIVYRKLAALPPGAAFFHAKSRRQEVTGVDLHERNTTGEYNYPILEVQGQGRYIGAALNVYNRHLLWWGEGDPMIFVDDDTWPPSLHGTGTEEYFNDAWGFHASMSPVSGVLLAGLSSPGRCFGPNAVFAFHLADSIPFRSRIRVSIEHGTENNLSNDYSSTAYWYAMPGARDFFVMPPAGERLAPPPSDWQKLRSERIREFLPQLRREVHEIASTLDRFPTDAQRHARRIRIVRLVFQLADPLSLPRAEVQRLESLMNAARGRPLTERFPVVDRILRDLAALL